ncbi:hypothetical protein, partial [Salmonella enterica subsp. enterica serovar Bredeney]
EVYCLNHSFSAQNPRSRRYQYQIGHYDEFTCVDHFPSPL